MSKAIANSEDCPVRSRSVALAVSPFCPLYFSLLVAPSAEVVISSKGKLVIQAVSRILDFTNSILTY